jgi:uncharacterized phage protein (TIGR01671 family)
MKKFRLYDKISKKYYYDGNLENGDIVVMSIEGGLQFSNKETYKEEDFTIQQCTGTKDKNGKEIYEGDTLIIQYCNIWRETQGYNKVEKEIVFRDGKFGYLTKEYYSTKIETLDCGSIYDFEIKRRN